jgi:hypothetical protein
VSKYSCSHYTLTYRGERKETRTIMRIYTTLFGIIAAAKISEQAEQQQRSHHHTPQLLLHGHSWKYGARNFLRRRPHDPLRSGRGRDLVARVWEVSGSRRQKWQEREREIEEKIWVVAQGLWFAMESVETREAGQDGEEMRGVHASVGQGR